MTLPSALTARALGRALAAARSPRATASRAPRASGPGSACSACLTIVCGQPNAITTTPRSTAAAHSLVCSTSIVYDHVSQIWQTGQATGSSTASNGAWGRPDTPSGIACGNDATTMAATDPSRSTAHCVHALQYTQSRGDRRVLLRVELWIVWTVWTIDSMDYRLTAWLPHSTDRRPAVASRSFDGNGLRPQ